MSTRTLFYIIQFNVVQKFLVCTLSHRLFFQASTNSATNPTRIKMSLLLHLHQQLTSKDMIPYFTKATNPQSILAHL